MSHDPHALPVTDPATEPRPDLNDRSSPTPDRNRRFLIAFTWIYLLLFAAAAICWRITVRSATLEHVRATIQQSVWDSAAELNELLVEFRDRPALQKLWLEGFSLANPEASIYLVDRTGRVRETMLGAPPVTDTVDVGPLAESLATELPRPRMFGQDPAGISREVPFSVAPADFYPAPRKDGVMLYLVPWREVSPRVAKSYVTVMLTVGMLSLVGAFIGCWRAVRYLERKLELLQRELDEEGDADFSSGSGIRDELDLLRVRLSDFRRHLFTERSLLEGRVKRRIQMILNLVHDLRIPLTAARGYGERLAAQGGQLDPAQRQSYVTTIQGRLAAEGRLARDLFTLADLDGAKFQEQSVHASPHRLLHQIVSDSAPIAARAQVTLSRDFPDALPELAHYPELLHRAIQNLTHNAIKFTPAGGTVTVAAEVREDGIAISVADTGIGIPEKELPYLFDSFYRVRGEEHEKREGTGLGLAISREIAVRHGGELTVQSVLGKGSRFTMVIPFAVTGEGAAVRPPGPLARAVSWAAKEVESIIAITCALLFVGALPLLPVSVILLGIGVELVLVCHVLRKHRHGERPAGLPQYAVQMQVSSLLSGAVYLLLLFGTNMPKLLTTFCVGAASAALPGFMKPMRAVSLFAPVLAISTYAVLNGKNAGTFGASAGVGTLIGIAAGVGIAKTRLRSLQFRLVSGFMVTTWALGGFSALFEIIYSERLLSTEIEQLTNGKAERVWEWAHRVQAAMADDDRRERAEGDPRNPAEYALARFALLAPIMNLAMMSSDCAGLNILASDAVVPPFNLLRAQARSEGSPWTCRDRVVAALPDTFSHLITRSPRTVHVYKSLIMVAPSTRSLSLAGKELQRTLLFGAARTLSYVAIAGALFAVFIYFALVRPLRLDLARLAVLREGMTSNFLEQWGGLTKSLLPAAKIVRRADAIKNASLAAETEDRRRREYVRWIGEQLRPSLELASYHCDELLADIAQDRWTEERAEELHQELLLQSELLRVSFELSKLEAQEIRVRRESVPVVELLEDAELEAVQLLSHRKVRVEIGECPDDLEVEVDRKLIELLIGTALRALYFVSPRHGIIAVAAVPDGAELAVRFEAEIGADRFGIVEGAMSLIERLLILLSTRPPELWRRESRVGIGIVLPRAESAQSAR